MSVRLTGFKEYADKLKNAPKAMLQRVDAEVEDCADEWVGKAEVSAPSHKGFLRGKISKKKEGGGWSVIVASAYAAYMEFGTGAYVQVPAELQSYAQTFKGKGEGGNIDEFFANILDWVRLKGITGNKSTGTKRKFDDYDAAFLIMMKILKVGVRPHPFFFIHKLGIEQRLMKNLKTIVDNI